MSECRATQVRRGSSTVLARYGFRFHQGERLVYEGDHTALSLDQRRAATLVGVSSCRAAARSYPLFLQ